MRYLLATKIVADLIRNPQGRVAQHIRRVGEALAARGEKHFSRADVHDGDSAIAWRLER